MSTPKIVTWRAHPPIPIRSMDWCAYYEDREYEGPMGHGATEEAAIADLVENYEVPS